jgi:GNAT superfamily N-acetyltransferase
MVSMGHHPRYQSLLIEACGLNRARELASWRCPVGEVPELVRQAQAEITALPQVALRGLDRDNLEAELIEALAVRDDALHGSWGHVALTRAESRALAGMLRSWMDPELGVVARVDGRVAAMALMVPNLNELIGDLRGRLWPLGWAKLRLRLRQQLVRSGRFLFGVRRGVARDLRYRRLGSAVLGELLRRCSSVGVEWGEFAWAFGEEFDGGELMRVLGGTVYKRYRLYEQII